MTVLRCALTARASSTASIRRCVSASLSRAQLRLRTAGAPANLPTSHQVDHEREFILSVLSTSATKRDARSYLARYQPQIRKRPVQRIPSRSEQAERTSKREVEEHNGWRLKQTGVNLGGLYTPSKAMLESPVFTHQELPEETNSEEEVVHPLHVALVKVRAVDLWDEATLHGVSLTLGQLTRLGLSIAVVVDCDEQAVPDAPEKITKEWRDRANDQADRLVESLCKTTPQGAVRINDALSKSDVQEEVAGKVDVRGGVGVEYPNLLLPLLRGGKIPVIPPVAFTKDEFKVTRVQPDDVMLALTREFSGISNVAQHQDRAAFPEDITLERVIVLDPLGGIPFPNRDDRAHVFINLEQEYEDIRRDLQQAQVAVSQSEAEKSKSWLSNSLARFSKRELASLPPVNPRILGSPDKPLRHLKNLDLVQRTLALLPPASSALILTPAEAAISAKPSDPSTPGVRTRRQKNPLIHNLLTDKPMVSSSHPDSPLAQIPSIMPATFVKRGMPVTMIPNPNTEPWRPPEPGQPTLDLTDPRIDFSRLITLIEDSFGRKLDVDHYLKRIKNKLAGVIIAGEYEGGAILTWEYPPDLIGPNGERIPRPPVPYLDKFAVLKRSQGSGGVADIVFKSMVRTCFPDGVVWRSRRDNPVNKWYFERSTGTLKLDAWDQTKWTMFWTTEDVEKDPLRWRDYQEVCRGIVASWMDKKPPD
ncbi:mitochondrial amino-acid acetyltransferase [Macrophomina phaseolina]|uniref:Amino-acid acetyltransferase, mitochondrial n=1 Tax=Macrophomina phaseolina TaxID=35725 RepID=A0ABQ8GEA9_9PEZI|nr:mitochondrial amino-acid acetyltransferase [Macrophomina phaseolina]